MTHSQLTKDQRAELERIWRGQWRYAHTAQRRAELESLGLIAREGNGWLLTPAGIELILK